jgi:hypothetical protein
MATLSFFLLDQQADGLLSAVGCRVRGGSWAGGGCSGGGGAVSGSRTGAGCSGAGGASTGGSRRGSRI